MARMRAKDRRRQLLKIAADLFARRGYRGATTAELTRLAGITEPILYRHFEHKLDLFISVIDDAGEQIISSLRNALEGLDDPQSRLSALLAGNPATGRPRRGPYRVILCAMAEARHIPAIRAAVRTHLTAMHAFLAAEIVQLQTKGAVRSDQTPQALARLLINLLIGGEMATWGVMPRTPATPRKIEPAALLRALLKAP